MVLTEVAGGIASAGLGLGNLWGYNRDNFLYDRRMRQETELKVAEWRAEQAGQWREDVRDLTGLTEQKMQSYMMVNTLQLSMCVVLFTEGRLQPGTPHWLLHMYTLTLASAFLFLLLSVWLAMHASVVVACEKAKLLTQFVRLPIPTWNQFEKMRTSAAAYETLGKRSLRVPFMDTVVENQLSGGASSSSPVKSIGKAVYCPTKGEMPMSSAGMARIDAQADRHGLTHGAQPGYQDTWGLEKGGDQVYELTQQPLESNRHIKLVRRAQTHYQCHDAFARISMTFGTNQLVLAISYFVQGYMGIGDGAPWPAIMVSAIMVSISIALFQLDISFTKSQHMQAFVLMTAGPALGSLSSIAFCMKDHRWKFIPEILLPPAFVSHGLWLLWALRACEVILHPGGEMLPTKFRLIMYLDVFGWIKHKTDRVEAQNRMASKVDGGYMGMRPDGRNGYSAMGGLSSSPDSMDSLEEACEPDIDSPRACMVLSSDDARRNLQERAHKVTEIRLTIESWQYEIATKKGFDETTRKRVDLLARRLQALGEKIPEILPPPSADRGAALRFLREIGFPEDQKRPSSSQTPLNDIELQRTGAGSEREMDFELDSTSTVGNHPVIRHSPADPHGMHPTSSHASSSSASPQPFASRQASGVEIGGLASEAEVRLRALADAEDQMDELENLEILYSRASQGAFAEEEGPIDDRLRSSSMLEASLGSSAANLMRRIRQRSKKRVAKAVPWLFGDVEERQKDPLYSRSYARRRNTAPSRQDCPGEVVVNQIGRGEPASDVCDIIDNDEIVMSMGPDQLPWQVFRYGTLTMVFLWMISPILLYGWYPYGRSMFGPQAPLNFQKEEQHEQSFAEQEDPDGTFSGALFSGKDLDYDLEPSIEEYENMPSLPAGQQLKVRWPFESTFAPRALTTDNTGKHLVVSEDFGVYFGQVVDGRIEVEDANFFGPSPTLAEKLPRQLRGREGNLTEYAVQPELPKNSFMQMPRCTALEGKQLKDISVVCSDDVHSLCRVIVLHSAGRLVTECPLYGPWGSTNSVDKDESAEPLSVKPLSEWKIAGSWLQHESVESLAVNPECEQAEEATVGEHAFDPAEVGCVVVGTSKGRIVQLRRHVGRKGALVPEWAMQERRGKVAQGSLNVFPGGFVLMLRSEIGVLQAVNAEKGTVLGQWRLPDNADWFSISGGGSSLFMMGHVKHISLTDDKRTTLWQFPLPPELQALFSAYVTGAAYDEQ